MFYHCSSDRALRISGLDATMAPMVASIPSSDIMRFRARSLERAAFPILAA